MIESIKRNRKGILLMVLSSLCACVGQLCWKLADDRGGWYLFIGFCFYGIGSVAMITAYRHGKLSVLQPVLSLNYVMAIFLAKIVLNEYITIFKIIVVLLIISGVLLIAGGDEEV